MQMIWFYSFLTIFLLSFNIGMFTMVPWFQVLICIRTWNIGHRLSGGQDRIYTMWTQQPTVNIKDNSIYLIIIIELYISQFLIHIYIATELSNKFVIVSYQISEFIYSFIWFFLNVSLELAKCIPGCTDPQPTTFIK